MESSIVMATVVWNCCGSDFVSLNLYVNMSVNWPLPVNWPVPNPATTLCLITFIFTCTWVFQASFIRNTCTHEPSDSIFKFWYLYIYCYVVTSIPRQIEIRPEWHPQPPNVFNTFPYKTWRHIYSTISNNLVCSLTVLTTVYWNVQVLKLFMYLYLSFIFILWRCLRALGRHHWRN